MSILKRQDNYSATQKNKNWQVTYVRVSSRLTFRLTNNKWMVRALTWACVYSLMFSQRWNTFEHQKEPQSMTITTWSSFVTQNRIQLRACDTRQNFILDAALQPPSKGEFLSFMFLHIYGGKQFSNIAQVCWEKEMKHAKELWSEGV